MKRNLFFVVLILMSIVGCSSNKEVQPDSPLNTSLLLNHSFFVNDFDKFMSIYSESRKQYASEELFDKLVQIKMSSKGSVEYKNLELMTFDNGEMILVKLYENSNGKVEIEDIIIVPEDIREFFKK